MVNFHRQSPLHCADIILQLTNLLAGPQNVRPTCLQTPPVAIDKVTAALADATLLSHSTSDAPISVVLKASSIAVCTVLQQHPAGHTQPLALFSGKL
nr:unnamed protein product [Spirometra erinaceieuropaei]